MIKKKLLIFYDWFYPGFNAGGPIQSLTNLAVELSNSFNIYVITSAFDINSSQSYNNIIINDWNEVFLPEAVLPVKIFYAGRKGVSKNTFQQALKEVSPDIVYLNGIFSYRFFLLPLIFFSKRKSVKVVVCPRGMLKRNAVSGKALKKKIYLDYLRISKASGVVCWHATSMEELHDIKKYFPKNKGILIAPNIPKTPRVTISYLKKATGNLKLVYLSLINEHKNLLLLLQTLKELEANISLDIYGPVINETYWKQCELSIKEQPEKFQYKGLVEPVNVQDLLEKYHAFILFTKGENFGHAIYESLSVGRPVITSHFTPWQMLFEKCAGENVDIRNVNDCKEKIMHFANMDQSEFNLFCDGSHRLCNIYYKNLGAATAYEKLFSK